MTKKKAGKRKKLTQSVEILDQSGATTPGIAYLIVRSRRVAFWKGAKRAAKIIGTIFLVALPFGFLEPFFFMVWGTALLAFLVLIAGPYLHLKFADETHSFKSVQGRCPHCKSDAALQPYLSTRLHAEFTVLCPSCGQTSRVALPED